MLGMAVSLNDIYSGSVRVKCLVTAVYPIEDEQSSP